jgi:Transposase and inactivated derivatives
MRKSRLSQYKQERLLELFIAGSTARIAAELVGVHRNLPHTIFTASEC